MLPFSTDLKGLSPKEQEAWLLAQLDRIRNETSVTDERKNGDDDAKGSGNNADNNASGLSRKRRRNISSNEAQDRSNNQEPLPPDPQGIYHSYLLLLP